MSKDGKRLVFVESFRKKTNVYLSKRRARLPDIGTRLYRIEHLRLTITTR